MNQSPRLPIARKVSPGATRKEITILFVIAQNRVSLLKINRPQFNMLAYVSLNLNPWGPRFALLAKYLLISEAFLLKQNLNLIRFSRCWQTLELAVLAVVFSTARQSLLRGPSLKRGDRWIRWRFMKVHNVCLQRAEPTAKVRITESRADIKVAASVQTPIINADPKTISNQGKDAAINPINSGGRSL